MLSASLRNLRAARPERLALRLRQPITSTFKTTSATFVASRHFSQSIKLLDAEAIDGKAIAKYAIY